jgi:excisionase family DNA binding protein
MTDRRPYTPEAGRWLTIDGVAAHLKVSRASVYNLVRDGLLPKPRLFGKRIKRFDREAIDGTDSSKAQSGKPEPTLGDVEW